MDSSGLLTATPTSTQLRLAIWQRPTLTCPLPAIEGGMMRRADRYRIVLSGVRRSFIILSKKGLGAMRRESAATATHSPL